MAGSISDFSFTRAASSATDLSAYFSLDATYAYEGSKSLHYTGYSSYPAYVYPASYVNADATGGLVRCRVMITNSTLRSSYWSKCGPTAMFSTNNTYGFAGIAQQDDLNGEDYVRFVLHTLNSGGELSSPSNYSPLFYLEEANYSNAKIANEDWVTLELRWEWVTSAYITGDDNICMIDFRVYNADMTDLLWNTSMQNVQLYTAQYRTTGRTGMFFDLENNASDIWVDYFESYKV